MTRSRARQSKPASSLLQDLTPVSSFTNLRELAKTYSHEEQVSIPQQHAQYSHYASPTDPDQFTTVPATLKIIKVLIEELQAAGGAGPQLTQDEIERLEEAGSDDGEWEDDPDAVDLGSSSVKAELMAFAEEKPYAQRQRDDETQAYLIEFFRGQAGKQGFQEVFGALTGEEQEKLRAYG